MFVDDVDYLVEDFVFNLYYQLQCAHLHIMSSWYFTASDAPSTWLLMQLHNTGSQEESPVAVPEEQT
jgi:copper(I)-binding protein